MGFDTNAFGLPAIDKQGWLHPNVVDKGRWGRRMLLVTGAAGNADGLYKYSQGWGALPDSGYFNINCLECGGDGVNPGDPSPNVARMPGDPYNVPVPLFIVDYTVQEGCDYSRKEWLLLRYVPLCGGAFALDPRLWEKLPVSRWELIKASKTYSTWDRRWHKDRKLLYKAAPICTPITIYGAEALPSEEETVKFTSGATLTIGAVNEINPPNEGWEAVEDKSW